jgi:hypothetical protein
MVLIMFCVLCKLSDVPDSLQGAHHQRHVGPSWHPPGSEFTFQQLPETDFYHRGSGGVSITGVGRLPQTAFYHPKSGAIAENGFLSPREVGRLPKTDFYHPGARRRGPAVLAAIDLQPHRHFEERLLNSQDT